MTIQRRRYEITDEEWKKISKYFPERIATTMGHPCNDTRTTINGIVWIGRSGAPWRDFPERYGDWNTVYKRFAKWQEEKLFEKIFNDLGVDADLQDLSIDSTSCKAHQHSAGAKKGVKTSQQTNILD